MEKFIKNKKLQGQILFTLCFIALFRILCFIPVPFVNRDALKQISKSGIFAYISVFSGGALSKFTVMATGISSYISASIVVQLLTYGIKKFSDIAKSPGGDRVVKKITIILGIFASFLISIGTTISMQKLYGILTNTSWYIYLLIAIIHSCGTGIAIWIGETITKKGIGNGVSFLILVNILSSIPNNILITKMQLESGQLSIAGLILCLLVIAIVSYGIVVFEKSERRIKIHYTKATARGKTSFGGNTGYFPIKLNMSGVMPIIFASTVIQMLSFLTSVIPGNIGTTLQKYMRYGELPNTIIMALLIFFFSFFYNALIFNPREISNNIQNNGGVVPGVRPGLPTANYIGNINKNLTFAGSIYLAAMALLPSIMFTKVGFAGIATTSLMILVGVGIETSEKIKLELQTGVFGSL